MRFFALTKSRSRSFRMYVKTMDVIYLLCCCVLINSSCLKAENVQVTTKNGIVEGKKATTVSWNKPYYSFQGIPFAKPPIGDLRFAAPVAVDNWEGVLDATEPRNTCIEMHEKSGDEDCLYLNVFTPSLNKTDLPVMIWIHGGGFTFVYVRNSLNGTDFFLDEDVIFVTIHYRLGVFGFLSTEDEVVPGNFGLKDQVLAINWVYDNIKSFGGDPNRITLMGQSAGATSASYLAMSPQMNGKIHGVIEQSGSALCLFGVSRQARIGAYMLGTLLGIETTDSNLLVEELRKKDAEELRQMSFKTYYAVVYGAGSFQGMLYLPVMEPENFKGALITNQTYEKFRKGHIIKIPHMNGINSFEGAYLTEEYEAFSTYYSNYDVMVKRYIPVDMNTRDERVGNMIRNHYTNGTKFLSNLTNAAHFGSDDQFVRPIVKAARLISKYVKTYFYHFSYEGDLGNNNRSIRGVSHGEELQYLFYNKDHGNVSQKDALTRLRLVKLWTNFAKYGNPTFYKDSFLQYQKWMPINPKNSNVHYLDIGKNLLMDVNPHNNDVDFWDDLYKKYGNPPYDTY